LFRRDQGRSDCADIDSWGCWRVLTEAIANERRGAISLRPFPGPDQPSPRLRRGKQDRAPTDPSGRKMDGALGATRRSCQNNPRR
jgi:hypothetical protein